MGCWRCVSEGLANGWLRWQREDGAALVDGEHQINVGVRSKVNDDDGDGDVTGKSLFELHHMKQGRDRSCRTQRTATRREEEEDEEERPKRQQRQRPVKYEESHAREKKS